MRSVSYFSISVAFLAGVCGGLVPRVFEMATASAASPETVRGARFELVDSVGKVRAALESLGLGGARLRFFDEEMRSPLELRSGAGGLSAIVLRGRDGKCGRRFKRTVLTNRRWSWATRTGRGEFSWELSRVMTGTQTVTPGRCYWATLPARTFMPDLL